MKVVAYVRQQFTQDDGTVLGLDGGSYEQGMMLRTLAATHCCWVPPFANDNEKLKTVLYLRAWQYLHVEKRFDPEADWKQLDKRATAKALNLKATPRTQAHKQAVCAAGSYLQLQSCIAYRAWRLGWGTKDVAAAIGIKRSVVKATLHNLKRTASRLGYDVGKRSPKFKHPERITGNPIIKTTRSEISAMLEAGETTRTLAKKFGIHYEGMRTNLKKMGLHRDFRYKPLYKDWRKTKARHCGRA